VPPPHSEDKRADDWIRTSMVRITGAAPFCIEPRRHSRAVKWGQAPRRLGASPQFTARSAGAQGFEPCAAVLEAACSPRSTLLFSFSRELPRALFQRSRKLAAKLQGRWRESNPSPAGSQPAVQKPLHHSHHQFRSQESGVRSQKRNAWLLTPDP